MAKFKVLGGDFKTGRGRFTLRSFSLPSFNLKAYFETVSLKDISNINRAPAETVELFVSDAENVLNQYKNDVTFIARLKDKRRFVGVADKETFFKVLEAHRASKRIASAQNAIAA